jgi:lysophospholipase L1-like esterase
LNADHLRVLVLGSSDITYVPESGRHTVPALLQPELRTRRPDIEWRLESALLYPTADMAARTRANVERTKPDVLYLSMGANTFIEKSVTFSIRKRWPRLYPAAAPIIRAAKSAAGGAREASPGPRGLLFRAPRRLARALFGMAPFIDPEVALKATRETFGYLATLDFPVIVRLAEGGIQQAYQREAARALTDAYNAAVRRLCAENGFPVFRLSEELGPRYGRTPDGLHSDAFTQAYEVTRAADLILKALGLEPAGGDALAKPQET